jgi:hypothetical protein
MEPTAIANAVRSALLERHYHGSDRLRQHDRQKHGHKHVDKGDGEQDDANQSYQDGTAEGHGGWSKADRWGMIDH